MSNVINLAQFPTLRYCQMFQHLILAASPKGKVFRRCFEERCAKREPTATKQQHPR